MSQSIHFARIKYFSEEFTKERKHDEILQELKKILKEEEKIDETLNKKFIEDIETQYLTLSANTSEIEKFLTNGSDIQLHPQSRYYFVTEKLWPVLQEEIFKQSQDIKKAKDYFDLAKDCIEIEGYYSKKMLVFEAS
ncbi:MAG: hypothetical protein JGK17_00340 [Microcoleus sp. PH2017_10_PVI_O_A]|uniref:hypothetical protein n=1 Tax=unclassified Microcoleus TaxID=2642155 RepID=UPI001D5793BB|nr:MULTISPECIES: hypothetical protein [unclassified Microcoleus]TAE85934.1 MAG: hypothetical protein EAZ83_00900 [Oscillatoriales cyanobacterium]MCC3404068.1 hypothetical protein [Microcoleus sp. PH2017_10_PVI_O_A]MCC3458151.1 hypothetical protein [Microcoleus sp. PH2017_11_PCY_U_A]MCC3476573.1 hypothetical protein [Microcoleus sp. PH2017_12_PCY_D_A]MCC3527087.1 hypothetical protein [Microcoleus sp. PH2017_21_RUC_O_A]